MHKCAFKTATVRKCNRKLKKSKFIPEFNQMNDNNTRSNSCTSLNSDNIDSSQTLKNATFMQKVKVKLGALWEWLKIYKKFIGPGFMIAVGYLDPGNWATDLQAGSQVLYFFKVYECMLVWI